MRAGLVTFTAMRPMGAMYEHRGQVAVKYQDRHGEQRVKGGPKLKASQTYPMAFGRAVASSFAKHFHEGALDVSAVDGPSVRQSLRMLEGDDHWSDASMGDVFHYLRS